MDRNIQLLAHRCGMARGTENTLEAIEQACNDGADGFECDVRMTMDGVPVVIHDADLWRVAINRGVISQMTKAELNQVRLRTGERIPSVAEVMDLVKQKYWRVTFELKDLSPELAKKLVKLSLDHKLSNERCQFLTYAKDGKLLTDLKQEYPYINTSAMFKMSYHLVERAKRLNVNTICVGWLSQTQKWFFDSMAEVFHLKDEIRKAHSHCYKVVAGITDQVSAVEYLVDLNVDGIYTNNVPNVRKILNR